MKRPGRVCADGEEAENQVSDVGQEGREGSENSSLRGSHRVGLRNAEGGADEADRLEEDARDAEEGSLVAHQLLSRNGKKCVALTVQPHHHRCVMIDDQPRPVFEPAHPGELSRRLEGKVFEHELLVNLNPNPVKDGAADRRNGDNRCGSRGAAERGDRQRENASTCEDRAQMSVFASDEKLGERRRIRRATATRADLSVKRLSPEASRSISNGRGNALSRRQRAPCVVKRETSDRFCAQQRLRALTDMSSPHVCRTNTR